MKNSFIFYASFDEALRELPDKSRLKMYDAITDYALRGIVRTDFKGIEKAIYSLIIPQIQANNNRYENGCKGGRPKKTETKPTGFENKNQNETNGYVSKKTKTKPNENENVNVNENDISPPIIPPIGEEGENFQKKFFSIYCQFKKHANMVHKGIDFEKLLEEFKRSSQLRKIFSWEVVVNSYDSILRGDFRDKENASAAVDVMAERERWYSNRRAKAEGEAASVLQRFLQNEEFKKIHKRLSALPFEIAQAEYKADGGDVTALKTLVKLKQEEARLTIQYRGIIERNGMTEEDLLPKWECEKCKDTGYLADGTMCKCYEVAL